MYQKHKKQCKNNNHVFFGVSDVSSRIRTKLNLVGDVVVRCLALMRLTADCGLGTGENERCADAGQRLRARANHLLVGQMLYLSEVIFNKPRQICRG